MPPLMFLPQALTQSTVYSLLLWHSRGGGAWRMQLVNPNHHVKGMTPGSSQPSRRRGAWRWGGGRACRGYGAAAIFICCADIAGGCIDVGHAPEVGCLVDLSEPGCQEPTVDASRMDASVRLDADAGDRFSEAEADSRDGALGPESGAPDGDAATD